MIIVIHANGRGQKEVCMGSTCMYRRDDDMQTS